MPAPTLNVLKSLGKSWSQLDAKASAMCTILATRCGPVAFQTGDSEGYSYGAQLKPLQEEIEVVDRAIDDGKRVALALEGPNQSRRPTKPRIVKST